MKFLLVLSCILFAAQALSPELVEQIKTHILDLGSKCKTEIEVTDEDIAPLMNHSPPTSPKGKCFIWCIYEKLGYLDADGKVNIAGKDAALAKIKEMDENLYTKMKKISETCIAEVKEQSDKCETAVEMFKCTQKEKEAVGIEPIDIKF